MFLEPVPPAPSEPAQSARSGSKTVWAAFALLAFLYLGLSWMRPLASPDEPRYTEIPREMVASGDWVTPRLNGVLFFDKPPLLYWLEASAIVVGGLNLFALRFWPAMLALAGCAAVFWTGSRLYDRRTGLFAAIILGTSVLYYALGQLITMDMAVSVLMSSALFAFLLGQREPAGPRRRWHFYAFYSLTGLAVLAKGLLAVAIPGAVIVLWMLICGRWRELRHIYLVSGILIGAAIALPWHVIIAQREPHWFDYYVVHEHFQRYFTPVSKRGQPFWFFFAVLPVGLLPWASFLPQALGSVLPGGWQAREKSAEAWFLVIWAGFVLAFFSASHSKLIAYILPAFPPMALLIARFWSCAERDEDSRAIRLGYLESGLIFVVFALGLPIAVRLQSAHGAINRSWLPCVIPITIVLGGIGLCWLWCAWRRSRLRFGAIAAGAVIATMLANPLVAVFQPPSARPIVEQLKHVLQPSDLVFTYQEFLHDVPLYLGRTIGAVEASSEEQEFGLKAEDHSDRYLDMKQFRNVWANRSRRVFVVMTAGQEALFRRKIRANVVEVARDRSYCIFTNLTLAPSEGE